MSEMWPEPGSPAWSAPLKAYIDALFIDAGGEPGLSSELRVNATHIQWRQTGGLWFDLIPLSSLKGADGANGLNIELQTTSTHIQWRVVGGVWANLMPLSALKGEDGADAFIPDDTMRMIKFNGVSWPTLMGPGVPFFVSVEPGAPAHAGEGFAIWLRRK